MITTSVSRTFLVLRGLTENFDKETLLFGKLFREDSLKNSPFELDNKITAYEFGTM